MTQRLVGILGVAALLACSASANAGLMRIEATALNLDTTVFLASDFTILYDDDGDGLFQFEELLSFSGTRFVNELLPSEQFQDLDELLGVTDIAGVATESGTPPDSALTEGWNFANAGGTIFPNTPIGDPIGAGSSFWEYRNVAVSEPGTLALLGAGLLGLGVMRRRKV